MFKEFLKLFDIMNITLFNYFIFYLTLPLTFPVYLMVKIADKVNKKNGFDTNYFNMSRLVFSGMFLTSLMSLMFMGIKTNLMYVTLSSWIIYYFAIPMILIMFFVNMGINDGSKEFEDGFEN